MVRWVCLFIYKEEWKKKIAPAIRRFNEEISLSI